MPRDSFVTLNEKNAEIARRASDYVAAIESGKTLVTLNPFALRKRVEDTYQALKEALGTPIDPLGEEFKRITADLEEGTDG